MDRWEYFVVAFANRSKHWVKDKVGNEPVELQQGINKAMNGLGLEGWELVSATSSVLYFKRRLDSHSDAARGR